MQQHTLKQHTLNHKKTAIIGTAIILACGALSPQAQAALASNAILKFTAGTWGCAVSGTYPSCTYGVTDVPTGSYFAMDNSGNGNVEKGEKTALSPNAGIVIGGTQPASGTHTGGPDGSEYPGIDQAWAFFGNTGLHQTTSAVTISSDDGAGNVTLDFSGWNVTWNAIASIPMGAGPDNGVAALSCGTACADGDTFTLNYAATVPVGDPSGFGGVGYTLYLQGTIEVPPALTTSNSSVGAGTYASNASSSDGRVSMADLTDTGNGNGLTDDSGYSFNGGLYDFTVTTASGAAAEVMITLTAPIPADAVYRKYIGGAWTTFVADGSNKIASAAKVSGSCPVVGATAYDHTNGLVEGDECMEITIVNDGAYDTNKSSTTTVEDPGGVASAVVQQVDTRTWGTSGCSMSEGTVNPAQRADWWLVAGFLAALAWLRRKRHTA